MRQAVTKAGTGRPSEGDTSRIHLTPACLPSPTARTAALGGGPAAGGGVWKVAIFGGWTWFSALPPRPISGSEMLNKALSPPGEGGFTTSPARADRGTLREPPLLLTDLRSRMHGTPRGSSRLPSALPVPAPRPRPPCGALPLRVPAGTWSAGPS